MERALGQKTIEGLGKKLQIAETNRTVQLTNIQEKAKNHNNKVQLVRERKSSQERAQEEKIVSETSKKHTVAEQRHVEKLNTIQEKAKTHNQKVQQIIASKAEESKEELDKVKAKIEDKMTRTSSFRTDKQEKAKAYNEKHQQKVEGIQTEQQKELDTKKTKIEDKLTHAATRKEEVIEKIKQTAAQSAVLKMPSPQKQEQEQ